jgi:ribosome biogenesis GTPase A
MAKLFLSKNLSIESKGDCMNYQWYPGHMTKAKRMMQENISLIDLVIELVDAREPISSRNPDIDELGKNKSRIVLLNKSDLADPRANKEWMTYFQNKGFHVVEINSKTGSGVKSIQSVVQEACKEKIERDRKRGILNRPVRAMVVGIPNVGKSTFINAFAGKACAKTGNKPGVTKGKQWIKLNKGLELLDTPGILWPKFEDQAIGMKLAFIGSINDEILLTDELALDLIKHLWKRYAHVIKERYSIEDMSAPLEVLKGIASNRRCYKKGEELDLDKAAAMFIDDFRSGKLGRISLEWPEEFTK